MPSPKQKLVADWLLKARHDIASAERLMLPAPILDTAVYHCQQAAEKSLKGYLALQGVPIQKTHDLTVLVARCSDFDDRFSALFDQCETLTPYGTEFRYPGSELQPELDEASAALVMAREVSDMVEQLVQSLLDDHD